MRRLTIDLKGADAPDRSYPVFIERDLLDRAGERIHPYAKNRKIVVVTDETVERIYGERITLALADANLNYRVVAIPPGETSKNLGTLGTLWDAFAEAGLTRTDMVLAFGGGVVGDLTGFAAATYLRGIPFIQMPTSLVAQVDSSLGGKTAIDLPRGKNLAGAFYQPKAVLVDPGLLESLPPDTFLDGLGEVVKTAAIADASLFERLATSTSTDELRDDIEDTVFKCIRIKADIVSRDEKEAGDRMLLNFGHTIGHAVEAALGYGKLSHGKCVAIGMAAITRAAEARGKSEPGTAATLVRALKLLGLPTELPPEARAGYEAALALDKKGSGDSISLVFLKRIGEAYVEQMPRTEAAKYLEFTA